MRFAKTWLWSVVICMLLWVTMASAAETVLFNAENYQVGALVGQDLVITQTTSPLLGTIWKHATGSGKSGSILWATNLATPFEIGVFLTCVDADADTPNIVRGIDRQCAGISLLSEKGISAHIEIRRVRPLISISGAVSTKFSITNTDGSVVVVSSSSPECPNDLASMELTLSVNNGTARLYNKDRLCIEFPFKNDIIYSKLMISIDQHDRLMKVKTNNAITQGTYDDGKKAGIQQCVANPASCGITKLDGISTNAFVTPANKMIAGVLISGGTKRVMVRASSVDGAVDPLLEIVTYPDRKPLGNNDSWATDPAAAELTQKKLAPARATDAAMIISLPPGLFTMEVSSKNGGSGANVIEVYDMAVFP